MENNKDNIQKYGVSVGGCIKDAPSKFDHIKRVTFAYDNSEFPVSFSLRKWAPDVRNQGNLSACGGFSSAAAVTILINKLNEYSGMQDEKTPVISPLYIYYNARIREDGADGYKTDEGTTLRSIMASLKDEGVIPEDIMPISKYSAKSKPPESIDPDCNFKIHEYLRILPGLKALHTYKSVLVIEKLPIVIGMLLYDTQMEGMKTTGFISAITDKSVCIGGHAMCVTGYINKDGKDYIEVLNSWGKDFGNLGYCYFPVEFLNNPDYVMDSWTFEKRYF